MRRKELPKYLKTVTRGGGEKKCREFRQIRLESREIRKSLSNAIGMEVALLVREMCSGVYDVLNDTM